MSTNTVVSFKNVTVSYDNRAVLNNVDFELKTGEFTYLIGQTGTGKSSFLKLIYRDALPDTGTVQVADYQVNNLKKREVPYLRRNLGIVFQDFQLLSDRNVFENVAFSLRVTGTKSKRIKQRVLEVLGMVGLSHKRNNMPGELSGGEQQRVVIARALANEPLIMLADEPTGNLDPAASSSIMDLLEQINNRGMAILMVTHDYRIVKEYPHRTLKLEDGTLSEVKVKN